jgi:serine/threonine protein kinase
MEAGEILDNRYRLTNRLGRGGGGEVFSAWDDFLKRDVAIKFVFLQIDSGGGFAELRKEAQILSSLRHRNIVSLYAIGASEKGDPYLVMELVSGKTLDDLINSDGPLSALMVLDIFVQLSDALSHAHHLGIMHRDIKPPNIMLVADADGRPQAKLLDFGIAKATGSQNQTKTATGLVVGTPQYMSPEYCLGQRYDQRCEIYSLGLIMWEALTGIQANQGENAVAAMHNAINEVLPAFSEACPERVIPEALENVVYRAISKDPQARYQSALDLHNDLESIQKSLAQGLTMPRIELPAKARPGAKRFSARLTAKSALAFVLITCVVLTSFLLVARVLKPDLFQSPKPSRVPQSPDSQAADSTPTTPEGLESAEFCLEWGDMAEERGHRRQAEAFYRKAIHAAEKENNPTLMTYAQLKLSLHKKDHAHASQFAKALLEDKSLAESLSPTRIEEVKSALK